MVRKRKRHTRLYTWASPKNRGKVDLKKYSKEIDEAIASVLPSYYNAVVAIGTDDFILETAFELTIEPKYIRKICSLIAKTKAIGRLCTTYHYKNGGISKQVFKGKDISM